MSCPHSLECKAWQCSNPWQEQRKRKRLGSWLTLPTHHSRWVKCKLPGWQARGLTNTDQTNTTTIKPLTQSWWSEATRTSYISQDTWWTDYHLCNRLILKTAIQSVLIGVAKVLANCGASNGRPVWWVMLSDNNTFVSSLVAKQLKFRVSGFIPYIPSH